MKAIETIIPAWRMAISNRPVLKPLIIHSDRGVQYACNAFRNQIFIRIDRPLFKGDVKHRFLLVCYSALLNCKDIILYKIRKKV